MQASGQTCIELMASALSNVSSANGSFSTEPQRSSNLQLRRALRGESEIDGMGVPAFATVGLSEFFLQVSFELVQRSALLR